MSTEPPPHFRPEGLHANAVPLATYDREGLRSQRLGQQFIESFEVMLHEEAHLAAKLRYRKSPLERGPFGGEFLGFLVKARLQTGEPVARVRQQFGVPTHLLSQKLQPLPDIVGVWFRIDACQGVRQLAIEEQRKLDVAPGRTDSPPGNR